MFNKTLSSKHCLMYMQYLIECHTTKCDVLAKKNLNSKIYPFSKFHPAGLLLAALNKVKKINKKY